MDETQVRDATGLGARTAQSSRWSIAVLIFGATLLLVPFIGGEFMPHLDEGALWVRATMPYTISFEEASKIAPQIRAILMSLSASHGGRLRAGTTRRRNRSNRLLQLRVLMSD